MPKLLHSKIVGQGVPLIILHGLLGMGDNWITLAHKYANAGYEIHLIDQRNHGKSFHNEEMSYDVMIEDLYYYIQFYQLNNFHLIGHSMGGKTAMFFALKYPSLINKLIIVDIAPKYYPPHHQFIFNALQKINLNNYSSRYEIDRKLKKDINQLAIRQFLLKNIARDKQQSFYWKANLPVLASSLDELGSALPPYSTIKINTLYIRGSKSKYILDKDIPLIKAHFPYAKVIEIPNTGHWVHAEQTEKFYNKTINFIKNN